MSSNTIDHRREVDMSHVGKWREHLNGEEEQRLSVIQERLDRIGARANELYSEKARIMQRAIKRKRRLEGKT